MDFQIQKLIDNGTSPLEDIEIEGDINKSLKEMGIKRNLKWI